MEHLRLKRAAVLVAGGLAVCLSYLAAWQGLAPEPQVGSVTFASIAFPGLITGLVMTAYIAWETRNVQLAKRRAEELSAQLVRKEIEIDRLSTLDELTGLQTRHQFDEILHLEFERMRRYERPLSLLLIEVDNLVELGENVAKLSKGYVLSELGGLLRQLLRANDQGCRFGTETLAILLPETTSDEARAVAQRVRELVDRHEFLGARFGGGIRLTISQGIATTPASDIQAEHDFTRAAEIALADARSSGLDQVRLHQPAERETPPAAPRKAS